MFAKKNKEIKEQLYRLNRLNIEQFYCPSCRNYRIGYKYSVKPDDKEYAADVFFKLVPVCYAYRCFACLDSFEEKLVKT